MTLPYMSAVVNETINYNLKYDDTGKHPRVGVLAYHINIPE